VAAEDPAAQRTKETLGPLKRPHTRGFGQRRNVCKSLRIVHRNIGKDFTVQANFGPFEAGHKRTIRETMKTGGGINADDPQATKIALAGLAIAIGKTPTPFNRFARFPE
jgi:hypothetical protein